MSKVVWDWSPLTRLKLCHWKNWKQIFCEQKCRVVLNTQISWPKKLLDGITRHPKCMSHRNVMGRIAYNLTLLMPGVSNTRPSLCGPGYHPIYLNHRLNYNFYEVLEYFLSPIVALEDIFYYLRGPRALFSSKCGPHIYLSLKPLLKVMVMSTYLDAATSS